MIFVECNADEFFIRGFSISKKDIKHESGKTRVISKVESFGDAIGVIDEDPQSNQPKELKNYIEVDKKSTIKLLKNSNKKIIIISPRLEDWLINKSMQVGLSLGNYGLPTVSKELHKLNPNNNIRYKEFLKDITSANDDEVITLRKWLKASVK